MIVRNDLPGQRNDLPGSHNHLPGQGKALPRLAVAFDAPSIEPLEPLLDELHGLPVLAKVGLSLYTAVGPTVVHHMHLSGFEVFLDMKLHDIPRQVALAVLAAVRLDVAVLTVHAAGGRAMLEAAVEAAAGRTRVVGVSVLTSLDEADMRELGMAGSVAETVARRLELCASAGLHGVVLSAQELHLAAALPPGFLRIVPGIRSGEIVNHQAGLPDDQRRVATATEAVLAGASMLVVGRPIAASPHPRATAEALLAEIANADRVRSQRIM